MPRYNVEYNKKWACFTSISDSFITEFMDKVDYEEWRKEQYGINNYKPVELSNVMTMEEVVSSIRLNHTYEEVMECLLGSGLPEIDCEKIINSLFR